MCSRLNSKLHQNYFAFTLFCQGLSNVTSRGKPTDEKREDELFNTNTVNGQTAVENFHKDEVERLNGCKKFSHR